MAGVTVAEIVRILRQDLGRDAGAAYARRIAQAGGLYAHEYEQAAERLEREARTQAEIDRLAPIDIRD